MVAYITSLQSTGGMKSWGKVAMISCESVEYCVGDDGRSMLVVASLLWFNMAKS